MDNADLTPEAISTSESQSDPADVKPAKKEFVIPEILVPVDVLEATTFFQQADSGQTN